MRKHLVVYSKGRAVAHGCGTQFESQPGKFQLELDAADRFDAFVEGYHHFNRLGLSVSVARGADGRAFLGISDDAIADALKARGLEFNSKLATGVLVEKIITLP